MMGNCGDCKFWASELSKLAAFRFSGNIGECRRHAPQGPFYASISGKSVSHIVNSFPPTAGDDWCGEFQIKGTDATPERIG